MTITLGKLHTLYIIKMARRKITLKEILLMYKDMNVINSITPERYTLVQRHLDALAFKKRILVDDSKNEHTYEIYK